MFERVVAKVRLRPLFLFAGKLNVIILRLLFAVYIII